MHWNVAPDALPGSARLVRVLDRWPNDRLSLTIARIMQNPVCALVVV